MPPSPQENDMPSIAVIYLAIMLGNNGWRYHDAVIFDKMADCQAAAQRINDEAFESEGVPFKPEKEAREWETRCFAFKAVSLGP
jgi:hypothetical protein